MQIELIVIPFRNRICILFLKTRFTIVLLIKKNDAFFVLNENDAWVTTFIEADVNGVISWLSIIRNLDMYRIAVFLL